MNAAAFAHLDADTLAAHLRHVTARHPQPYPVLLYQRVDEGEDPALWMASVDRAREWFYFAASGNTPTEAIDGRLEALISGRADSVTADDWIADDAADERPDGDERAELAAEIRARTGQTLPETDLAVVSFAARDGFDVEALWMHQYRTETETELRTLRRYLRPARDALVRHQRPEDLHGLIDMLEAALRAVASPMDDKARTVGWTDAIGAAKVDAAAWLLQEALWPFMGRLLASGCDAEATVAAACEQRAATLCRTLDAWLASVSLRRIAARGTIFEGRPLLPDAYREAIVDVEAYTSHPEMGAQQQVARRGEQLLQHLRRVTAGGTDQAVKRAQRSTSRFLRSTARVFGAV